MNIKNWKKKVQEERNSTFSEIQKEFDSIAYSDVVIFVKLQAKSLD